MSLTQQEARNVVRKALKRVPEGEEIRHLNIMPMMDMMTILLVAFIFQLSSGAAALTAGTVQLPVAKSQETLEAEGAIMLIVTPDALVVEQEEIVSIRDGSVDKQYKENNDPKSLKIPRLTRFLGALRDNLRAKAKQSGEPFDDRGNLYIIADSATPYRLLLECIYSAKSEGAGFKEFHLVVLRPEEGETHKKPDDK